MLTLRTRVSQVVGTIGSCHAALCNIHSALLPLNKQPKGIFVLIRKFSNFDKAKVIVRRQLVAGAKVALVVTKTHYPRIEYSKIA